MTSKPIIEFSHVTKDFSLQSHKTFKEFLPALFFGEKTVDKFTVLSDISFQINQGDCVGIVGPNGSGKSTILKLIAGVMSPTKGTVKVHGRISPLIELGAGMHPELTGRENIYLNGAILGLKRKQIDTNFQNIVDFSELQEYLDQPIKHYSSGMYMRLAFSIAVHVNPEILIVDEILAVGDSGFQAKCFEKMNEFKKNGVTILFVSHSLETVSNFCNKAIYLKNTQIVKEGNSKIVVDSYYQDQITSNLKRKNSTISFSKNELLPCYITYIEHLNNKINNIYSSENKIEIKIIITSKSRLPNINIGFSIYSEINNFTIFGTNSQIDKQNVVLEEGTNDIVFQIKNVFLTGKYGATIVIFKEFNKIIDTKTIENIFEVKNPQQKEIGVARIEHSWKI